MNRSVTLITICTALICGFSSAAEDDPVEQKLTNAKEEFEKSADKARSGLLADLKKRVESAQKAGDLKTLEKVQAEAKTFEDSGELPKSVPVKTYESQMRMARAKLEEGYGAAVKQYTKDGKLPLAKAVQQELDEFKKGGKLQPLVANDPFQSGSTWATDPPRKWVLTVTERKGEAFRARFDFGDGKEQVVTGTVKDGTMSWLAKDVRGTNGATGSDTKAKLTSDKNGPLLDMTWRKEGGGGGTCILRLNKGR